MTFITKYLLQTLKCMSTIRRGYPRNKQIHFQVWGSPLQSISKFRCVESNCLYSCQNGQHREITPIGKALSFLSVFKEVIIVAQKGVQNPYTEKEKIHDNTHTLLKDRQDSDTTLTGKEKIKSARDIMSIFIHQHYNTVGLQCASDLILKSQAQHFISLLETLAIT